MLKFDRVLFISLFLKFGLARFALATDPPVTDLAFAPDHRSLVAVSQVGVRHFSWPELELLRTIQVTPEKIRCLAFSPDAKTLAIGGGLAAELGQVELLAWPKLERLQLIESHDDSVRDVAWINDDRLVSVSMDRNVKSIQLDGSAFVSKSFPGHSRSVSAVCVLSNGKILVTAAEDFSLRVWDAESGKAIRSLNQHSKPVHALAVKNANAKLPMVASASADRTIRFWQPTIGRMVRYIRLESEPLAVAWSNDGNHIAASCVDGKVRMVDVARLEVTQAESAIEGWAYAVAVHPTDRSLAVGGEGGAVVRVMLGTP